MTVKEPQQNSMLEEVVEQAGLQKWMAWIDDAIPIMAEYPKGESVEEAEEKEQEDHHLKRFLRRKRKKYLQRR